MCVTYLTRLGKLLLACCFLTKLIQLQKLAVQAVVEMRQTPPKEFENAAGGNPVTRFWRRSVDRARIIVPLLETLSRRAEGLTLSLRHRRPDPGICGPVPWVQMSALVIWTAGLVWWAVARTGGSLT